MSISRTIINWYYIKYDYIIKYRMLWYVTWTFGYGIEHFFRVLDISRSKAPKIKYSIKPRYTLAKDFDPELDIELDITVKTFHKRIGINTISNNIIYYCLVGITNLVDDKKNIQ